MPKHTIRAINNRFKTGFFPSYDWAENLYNWYKSPTQQKRPLQCREDKRGRTMIGNGCFRTWRHELNAAAQIPRNNLPELRFPINYGGFKIWVYLEFRLWEKVPGFYWQAMYRRDGATRWSQEITRATERKPFNQITEEDARRFLASVLMPPGYWLEYQLENDQRREATIKARRSKAAFVQRHSIFAVQRSIERNRQKHRDKTGLLAAVENLYWTDEDPEEFIFAL